MLDGTAIKTDALPDVSQGRPSNEPQSPSQPTPRTYTKQEYDNGIRKRHSALDNEIATLKKQLEEKETTLQAQLQDKDNQLADIAAERELLKADIDALASDDPNKFNLIKKEREVRAEETRLKAERKTHEERIKKADAFERKELVQTIVGDYKDADANKLLRLCAKVTSEEEIREIADTVWDRKIDESATTEPVAPGLKPDSGKTSGGGIDFSRMSADEKLVWACAHPLENERLKRR